MWKGRNIMRAIRERQFFDALYWGGVFIWAGLVVGAEGLGYLPQVGEAGVWSWILFGAGVYGLAGALLRLASSRYSKPTTWDYIWSGGLLIIGLGGFVNVEVVWALIPLLVGVAMLGNILFRRG